MRQNPHVRICGGPGSATTLVYPTPRSLQGCATMLLDTLRALIRLPEVLWPVIATLCLPSTCLGHRLAHRDDRRLHVSVRTVFTTGC